MSFNAREAAQRLFDIADAIEKKAAQKTKFVCAGCNHTASLESINDSRAKFASENDISSVSAVSIEDTISCKACGGDMKYAATEESEKFFVEASEDSDEEVVDEIEETPEDEAADEDVVDETPEEEEIEEVDEVVEPAEDESDDESEEKAEKKPKKRTTKDKEDSDGKVELKDEPKAQFGDGDKKKPKSKTAFDTAVDRYSNY
jgi:hypothetical protein